MNINLTDGSGGHPVEPDDCNLQGDIDEHIEIMRSASPEPGYTGRVMLLSDPEYPGAYRVWLEQPPARPDLDPRYRDSHPVWAWVTPDGMVIQTQRPWAVTD